MKQIKETINPMIVPGIGLDEAIVIELINQEFGFINDSWVKIKSRETNQKVARQLLFKCLIDHMGYTLAAAGAVCNRDHCTALHGKNIIEDVFWNDPQYGDKVKHVYYRCVEIKKGYFQLKKGEK